MMNGRQKDWGFILLVISLVMLVGYLLENL